MDTKTITILCVLAVAIVTVVAVPTTASYDLVPTSESYDLTVDGGVDIPDRNVSINGTQTTVSSVGSVALGSTVKANVSSPAGDTVSVILVDTSGERHAKLRITGNESISIPTDGLKPGTYYIAVQDGETVERAQQVVVSGPDVSLSRATLNDAGTLSARVGVIPSENISFEFVELVVTDGKAEQVQSMTILRHGLYEGTMSTDGLSSGEYSVYARLVTDSGEYVGMSGTMNVTVSGEA